MRWKQTEETVVEVLAIVFTSLLFIALGVRGLMLAHEEVVKWWQGL